VNSDNFDESKRAFWDDFSAAADQRKKTGSSIGTSAMGKGGSRQGGAQGSAKEEWDDW
jgi:ADP-ribosylation factor GTPase-activating protein 1